MTKTFCKLFDCGPGVAFRVLVVREVYGRRGILLHAAVLRSCSSRFHLFEHMAKQVDQRSAADECDHQQHFAVRQPSERVPRRLRCFRWNPRYVSHTDVPRVLRRPQATHEK